MPTSQQLADDLLRVHQAKRTNRAKIIMDTETSAQRSAVAALIGRCEGLIWDHELQIPEAERKRLFALLTETCAAFDMNPPQMEAAE